MQRKFHHLARGVIEHNGVFLLARPIGKGHTFLPGGHIEPFESLTNSLQRELHEEAGIRAETFVYLGVMENHYEEKGILHVELCHLIRVEGHGLTPLHPVTSREIHLEFLWATPNDFERLNLLPVALREILPQQRNYRALHITDLEK